MERYTFGKVKADIEFIVQCELTENEVRALDALAGYGHQNFLKVFYKHLGISYMQPFEKDLIQLFEKIKTLRPALDKADEARKKMNLPQRTKGY